MLYLMTIKTKFILLGVKIPKGNLNNYADGFRLFNNPKDGKVDVEQIELPMLKDRRVNHSSLIINNRLFVMFGKKEGVFCSSIEYLDLNHIENGF